MQHRRELLSPSLLLQDTDCGRGIWQSTLLYCHSPRSSCSPCYWDSSHAHLSQVDTELPRIREAAPGLTTVNGRTGLQTQESLPYSSFGHSSLWPREVFKCPSQEIHRPLCSVSSRLQAGSVKSQIFRRLLTVNEIQTGEAL